jgi:soluble P-type ATPase
MDTNPMSVPYSIASREIYDTIVKGGTLFEASVMKIKVLEDIMFHVYTAVVIIDTKVGVIGLREGG